MLPLNNTQTTTTTTAAETMADERYPDPTVLASATTTRTFGRFAVSSRKLPISKAGPIDAMSARLGIPVPEMIFGDNAVALAHAAAGWRLVFRAEDALDLVDKTGEAGLLRVAHAGVWTRSRESSGAADIREVVRPFDWSYSTTYRGTVELDRRQEERQQLPPA